MKNKLMRLHDKLLSRQRSIIETINDQLKNISQIEHSRHRSPVNFCSHVLCGLIAYCHQPKKRFSALGGFPDLKRLNQEAEPSSRLAFASICLTRTQVYYLLLMLIFCLVSQEQFQ
jgi:hypothetical protein